MPASSSDHAAAPSGASEGSRDGASGLVLAPFRALRYHAAALRELGLVTSPPYDVINAQAVERLRARHPHNIVRLILPHADEDVAATLRQWLSEQVLVRDDADALYVYEYTVGGRRVRGLVGALALRALSQRVILPHEQVLPGPVAGRTALMASTRANLEPILLVYDGDGAASDVVDATTSTPHAFSTVTSDGSEHTVWRIGDPQALATISADLAPRQALIADGHHRYAAYQECQREHEGDAWGFGLAMLVDQVRHPLHLGAIHRVAPGLGLEAARSRSPGMSWTDYGTDAAAARSGLDSWDDGHAFLLTDGDRWALLTGAGEDIDTALLHDDLLPRWDVADEDVLYVHDPENARDRARDVAGVAVILRPPAVAAVIAASSQGQMLPRKTTSFGPKPRMGLLLRLLDEN
ncbi:MAG TPA: DUF1015 domain-containing protein [Nocardioidaceae bacterium]|nr:DUF1015 domain-containing protein [Nocardioidaceae bacterium]